MLLAILFLALALRIVGLNWDDHSHLHPDERFLTSMAAVVGEADNLTARTRERCQGSGKYEYFNTACSVYNPNNLDDGSYAYGTLPLFMVRLVSEQLAVYSDDDSWLTYDYVHFVGRTVNSIADMMTVFFVFLIGTRLFSVRHGLIAAFFYACAVLPIQLSHYWTVDILANLFFVIGLYALVEISKNGWPHWYLLFGFALGCGVASRVNIAPFAAMLPVAVFIYLQSRRGKVSRRGWLYRAWAAVLLMTFAGILAFFTFRVFQPYAFVGPTFSDWGALNEKWLEDIAYVSNLSSEPSDGWPPSNQWFGRVKYLYPYWNLITWGLGSPLGIAASLALAWAIYQQIQTKRLSMTVGIFTVWFVLYFGWQGGLHQMTMRYYLPLYGILCLLATWGLLQLKWPLRKYITIGILISTLMWAFAFTRIYRQPLTRLEASEWVVENFPASVTFETDNGTLYPAELFGEGLRYPLTTVVNGESYISETFEINAELRLSGFELVFSDNVPSTINWRLLAEDDPYAERPLIHVSTQHSGTSTIAYQFTPEELSALSDGFYNWHFDVNWEGDQPFRYVVPTFQWTDREDATRHSPITFLSPYRSVKFASLKNNGVELNLKTAPEVTGFYIPHFVGEAGDLTLKVGEEAILARPIEAERERHVMGAEWYYELEHPVVLATDAPVWLSSSQPVYIVGTVIATEGPWDDHIPWGYCTRDADESPYLVRFVEDCERFDPFGSNFYGWVELGMAETDTYPKALAMQDILYKADYLTISSNRFYDTLPRYPVFEPEPRIRNRFVMSTQYYQDLFDGKLNYEIIREFHQFPGFLGLDFRDQVLPTAGVPAWMNELEAEEAFTVYDHPTVFILQNNGFAPDQLSLELTEDDPRNKIDLADYDSTFTPSEERASAQDEQNALLRWVVGFLVLGWLAYPMMFVLFPALPLRGFGLGRGAGWLILTLGSWWLTATTGGSFWTQNALWGFVGLFALVNLGLALRYRQDLWGYLRQNIRQILLYELLFLLALGFGLYLRAVNPDLWHEARGGEKPMDFAYLNATLRTSDFPPPNPWLAGYDINYYYYGFVQASFPIKLWNIAPEVGVNLVLGTLYAVVTVNIFTLAYAVLGMAEKIVPRFRVIAALLGTGFVMLAGNLGTLYLMFNPEPNMHPHRWYWYPTRIIAESANRLYNGGPITEMPMFSFLFGDPHAHTFTLLPVTLYLVALWLLVTHKQKWMGWVVGMLSGLIFMGNIWDVVLYVPLGALAIWWATRDVRKFVILGGIVSLGGILTIAPYYLDFTVGADRGIETWKEESSLFEPFMLTWGIPIGIMGVWLLTRLKAILVPNADSPVEIGLLLVGLAILYFIPNDLQRASLLCTLYAVTGLTLARFDQKSLRPIHFFTSLIFTIILLMEHYVIKGDVGRLNTVFKLSFQLWIWLGVLMALVLYIMWTSYRMRIQVAACIVLLGFGFLYPIKAIPGRAADSQTGELTFDGFEYTRSLRFPSNAWRTYTSRDNDLARYMRANLDGFPVIAEWYTAEYQWNSRISYQTGLPSIVGWANHMRQQYQHLHPEIETRIAEQQLLYNTTSIDDVRYILDKYNVAYIVVGVQERSVMQPETYAIYATMLENGELSLVYDKPFTQLYKVEKED